MIKTLKLIAISVLGLVLLRELRIGKLTALPKSYSTSPLELPVCEEEPMPRQPAMFVIDSIHRFEQIIVAYPKSYLDKFPPSTLRNMKFLGVADLNLISTCTAESQVVDSPGMKKPSVWFICYN